MFDVDPGRVVVAGISDGTSDALSVGLASQDPALPIERISRRIVAVLE